MRLRVTQIQSANSCYYTHRFADDYMAHYRRKVILSGCALKKERLKPQGPFEDAKLGRYQVERWDLSEDPYWSWYGFTLVTEWLCIGGDMTFAFEGDVKVSVINTLRDNPCPKELVPQIYIEQEGIVKSWGYLTDKTEVVVAFEDKLGKALLNDGHLEFDVNDPTSWKDGKLPEPHLLGYPLNGHPIQSQASQVPNTRTFEPEQNWFNKGFLHNPNHSLQQGKP